MSDGPLINPTNRLRKTSVGTSNFHLSARLRQSRSLGYLVCPDYLVDLVCFVYLVDLVYLVSPMSLVQPNEQDRLADFFSIR